MINRVNDRVLLGNTALVEGQGFEGIGYCQSSYAKLDRNEEPFIIFKLKTTVGTVISCFLYGVNKGDGGIQQDLTHRYVKIKGDVTEYSGRTTIILAEIIEEKNITKEEEEQFNRKISEKEIEKYYENSQNIFKQLGSNFFIDSKLKYFSTDFIDNGRVGSPLLILNKILCSCEALSLGEDDEFEVKMILTSYEVYIRYLKYLKLMEKGNNFTVIELNKLINNVDKKIDLLNNYIVECLEELIKGNKSCSLVPMLVCNIIREHLDFLSYKEEWNKLLEGGEIKIKDRTFRKYKERME